MALADDAELIVLAPGVKEFGEDPGIDKLIRKYGYCGTPEALEAVKNNADLAANLSAAAHLIHGSSEGRFTITYCPGHLTREEVESVNFGYAPLDEMTTRYDPAKLQGRLQYGRRRGDLLHLQSGARAVGLSRPLRHIRSRFHQRGSTRCQFGSTCSRISASSSRLRNGSLRYRSSRRAT